MKATNMLKIKTSDQDTIRPSHQPLLFIYFHRARIETIQISGRKVFQRAGSMTDKACFPSPLFNPWDSDQMRQAETCPTLLF